MKLLIGTPAIGVPTWSYTQALVNLTIPVPHTFMAARGYEGVAHARNTLAEIALDEDYDWLLYVDADAVLHPGTVIRLLERQKEIVGALCFKREVPVLPVVGDGDKGVERYHVEEIKEWLAKHPDLLAPTGYALMTPPPEDSLVKRDIVGAHTLLVHSSVFQRVRRPWFKRTRAKTGAGEDLYFLRKARRSGFDVWLDRSLISGHQWGEWIIGGREFTVWQNFADWASGQ